MMIESGLLFSTATLVTVAIYLTGSLATVNAIDSIVQLAVRANCTRYNSKTNTMLPLDHNPPADHVNFLNLHF